VKTRTPGVIQPSVADASAASTTSSPLIFGEKSPLLTLWRPARATSWCIDRRASVDNTLKAQAEAVLSQFSLDNESGALRRLSPSRPRQVMQQNAGQQVETVVD